ncbi:uncharacterized protein LOC100904547 [Galendromus occidentalis]|uniref:Uncharacterized protein LOC100904547 n=1 Tax=Galendromus occidentalis TaxID=34638 RepID=A0AAJ6QN37_9ACAR|nr:uncharacterized protein LOC100904547 [Galendromus occidentalis]
MSAETRYIQFNAQMPVLNEGPVCPDFTDAFGRQIAGFKCPVMSGARVFCCGQSTQPLCCKEFIGKTPDHLKNTDAEALLLLIGGVVSCVLFLTTIIVASCVICKRRNHTRHKRARSHGGNVINLEDLSDEDLHTRLERPPTYSRSTAMTVAADMYCPDQSGSDSITIEPAPSYAAAMAREMGEPPPILHQGHVGPSNVNFNGMYVEPPPPYQEYPEPNSRIIVCRHGGTLESHNTDLTVRFQY